MEEEPGSRRGGKTTDPRVRARGGASRARASSILPPNSPPPPSNVSLFSKISLALHRLGTSQRLGSALTKSFGAANDLPVELTLVPMAFHASIIPLNQRFANSSRQRARQPLARIAIVVCPRRLAAGYLRRIIRQSRGTRQANYATTAMTPTAMTRTCGKRDSEHEHAHLLPVARVREPSMAPFAV